MMPISNTEATFENDLTSAPASSVPETRVKGAMNIVFLRHPHRPDEDPIEVENTGEALTPYMVVGYQQVRSQSK